MYSELRYWPKHKAIPGGWVLAHEMNALHHGEYSILIKCANGAEKDDSCVITASNRSTLTASFTRNQEKKMLPLRDLNKVEQDVNQVIPEYSEWLTHDFTQMVVKDIYDTLVRGAEKLEKDGKERSFWSYIQEPSQTSFDKHRYAAFRHSLALHDRADGQGHAMDYDGKPHLAMALARCFIARGQQIELKRGETMRDVPEFIDE